MLSYHVPICSNTSSSWHIWLCNCTCMCLLWWASFSCKLTSGSQFSTAFFSINDFWSTTKILHQWMVQVLRLWLKVPLQVLPSAVARRGRQNAALAVAVLGKRVNEGAWKLLEALVRIRPHLSSRGRWMHIVPREINHRTDVLQAHFFKPRSEAVWCVLIFGKTDWTPQAIPKILQTRSN